jgi:hypothetical protein
MLEYLETINSDSDFILESDTDDTSEEEEDAPHTKSQLLALCLTVKRMAWMMKNTGKLCHVSNFFVFLSNSKNCLDLSIWLLILLLLLSSVYSSQA